MVQGVNEKAENCIGEVTDPHKRQVWMSDLLKTSLTVYHDVCVGQALTKLFCG